MSAVPAHHHTWSLRVTRDLANGATTLTVCGRLGTYGAHDLRAALGVAPPPGTRVLLDLEGVDYISSAGIAVLQEASVSLGEAGSRMELLRTSEAVRLALRLAGADVGEVGS